MGDDISKAFLSNQPDDMEDPFILEDGANIAVIGGGPTGSFFSYFALKMSKMLGKELNVTIYEPKDFHKDGPGGCNKCGGIISELLVQTLAVEGINLPDSLVQKGIDSYRLHTARGKAFIATPSHEKTIATVYRGGGPKGLIGSHKESFDQFLLDQAVKEGAVLCPEKVDRIDYTGKKPVLYSKDQSLQDADLVVGSFGVNSTTQKIFENMDFGYKEPSTIKTAIAEIGMDKDMIAKSFGTSIQLFLLPDENIKFAAIIPKETFVTLCILGKNIEANTAPDFLNNEIVKSIMPENFDFNLNCRCVPKMNVNAPVTPFADRVVICGDAGSTRLFKDGLGAAYLMGKAAAKTAVFNGVGKHHFREGYYPVYRNIIVDNWYGRSLYFVTDLFKKYGILTSFMLNIVREEQQDPEDPKRLSSILWNMFTGNERYKNVFRTAIGLPFHYHLYKELGSIILGGTNERR